MAVILGCLISCFSCACVSIMLYVWEVAALWEIKALWDIQSLSFVCKVF